MNKKPKQPRPVLTTKSQIVHALRRHLWLNSNERSACLKRDGYRCLDCGGKQSTAKGREFKVEVDHINEIGDQWDKLVEAIRRHLLVPHDQLETVCKPCHLIRTETRRRIEKPEQGALL